VASDLRQELGMIRSQLVEARAAKVEVGDEVTSLRSTLEVREQLSTKQLVAIDLQVGAHTRPLFSPT
jgi:hypothetical protein